MIYADYEYYQNTYCGSNITDENTFNRLALKASAFLDAVTYNRIDKAQLIPNAVKNATCAVVDVIQGYESGESGVASESVGRVSKTYANAEGKTLEKESYAVAYPFLVNTGLLYRGLP